MMQALNADQRTGYFNGKPSYTIQQAAAQLGRENLSWSSSLGAPVTVTYAYRASAPASMPDDTAGFSQFQYNQIAATEKALAAWSAVAGITFVRVGAGTSGTNAYSDNATILFGNYSSGEDGSSAFAYMPGSTSSSSVTGDVWINNSLSESSKLDPGQDGFLTLLHEIGHAIGLSHPSDYDASSTGPAITYAKDASYFEDSVEYSVMSYFAASATGSDVENLYGAPSTPLIDDIAAAQRLYGANPQGNAGNTTYSLAWGAIADASGTDTLDYHVSYANQTIDLRAGNFSDVMGAHGNLAIALGTTIENAIGGQGNDTIIGNDAGNRLQGGDGDDLLRGGVGNDTYIGDGGSDRVILGGNVWDYLLVDGGSNGLILESRNGSGNDWLYPSIETVQFQNGQYLSLGDVHAYVTADSLGGYKPILATYLEMNRFAGSSSADRLFVDANASDYTLSRGLLPTTTSQVGDFVLTDSAGNQVVVGEAVDQISFRNGQYLSLRDLGAYIPGSAAFSEGGAQDDILLQSKASGFEMYSGGAGNDTVYLGGNIWDYTLSNFSGTATKDGAQRSGLALVALNGSGIEFIDNSVETVQFRNGQYLSLHDVPAYVTAAGQAFTGVRVVPDGVSSSSTILTSSSSDTLYLDGNVKDYFVDRGSDGSFDFQNGQTSISIAEGLSTVHFQNGQYLSVDDLRSYARTGTFTNGTASDDLLWAASSGDQYLNGGGGFDDAFLFGNVGDYSLAKFSREVSIQLSTGVMELTTVTGFELVSKNGTGKIDVDPSTEIIHFQNGQYLSYQDLSAYIHA